MAEAVSMARVPTDGLSVAAQVAPWPPPALVIPMASRLNLVVAVAEEE